MERVLIDSPGESIEENTESKLIQLKALTQLTFATVLEANQSIDRRKF